ncbi:MAG: pinensin family lanthipeptide [Bacteroidota bacterium]
MKKKKLNLDSLKVTSFVTSLDCDNKLTVKGGDSCFGAVCLQTNLTDGPGVCVTEAQTCNEHCVTQGLPVFVCMPAPSACPPCAGTGILCSNGCDGTDGGFGCPV